MTALPPPACGACGEPATCAYDYGQGTQLACPAHDPTRQPGWAAAAQPPGFAYRTLAPPPASPPWPPPAENR